MIRNVVQRGNSVPHRRRTYLWRLLFVCLAAGTVVVGPNGFWLNSAGANAATQKSAPIASHSTDDGHPASPPAFATPPPSTPPKDPNAAEVQRGLEPPADTGNCDAVRAKVAATPQAQRPKRFVCTAPNPDWHPTRQEFLDSIGSAAPSGSAPAKGLTPTAPAGGQVVDGGETTTATGWVGTIPDWCRDYYFKQLDDGETPTEDWIYHRQEGCEVGHSFIIANDAGTGAEIGRTLYTITQFLSMPVTSGLTMTMHTRFRIPVGTLFAGTTYSGNANCDTDALGLGCSSDGGFGEQDAMNSGGTDGGVVPLTPTEFIAEGDWHFYSPFAGFFVTPPPGLVAVQPIAIGRPATARCDDVLFSTQNPGCILPATPRLNYSLSGPRNELAHHIQQAQGSGLPFLLHRLTDSVKIGRNRNGSCPASLPRPADATLSCDEYPFAASYEGSVTGNGGLSSTNGRSWPGCNIFLGPSTGFPGYSICYINADQNSQGGNDYLTLIKNNRIIDGDAFYVSVTK